MAPTVVEAYRVVACWAAVMMSVDDEVFDDFVEDVGRGLGLSG